MVDQKPSVAGSAGCDPAREVHTRVEPVVDNIQSILSEPSWVVKVGKVTETDILLSQDQIVEVLVWPASRSTRRSGTNNLNPAQAEEGVW